MNSLEKFKVWLREKAKLGMTEGRSFELLFSAWEAGRQSEMNWQPIGTAPKTGQYLAKKGKKIGIGSLDKHLSPPQHWASDRWGDQFEPTHWMPLPKAPE